MSKLHNFVVFCPDYTDEGCFARRLSVLPQHFEEIQPLIADGTVKMGGALFSPDTLNASEKEKKLVGSAIMIQAPSLEDVKRIVEKDIYYKANVWDKERLVILPYLLSVPGEWKLD